MKKIVYIFLLLAIPFSLNAYTFTRTLSVGSVGEDVFQLQKILNSNPNTRVSETGVGSLNNESYYFGEKTKQAVIRMQNLFSDQILRPVGLNIGSGFVGNSTLNFLNASQSQSGVTPTTIVNATNKPIVTSVTPKEIKDGDAITILGTNFSPQNNTVLLGFESKTAYTNIKSTENGTKLEIKYKSSMQKVFDDKYKKLSNKEKKKVLEQFSKIPVAVSVINQNDDQSNFEVINFILK
jgi:hypothetical protein